MSKFCLYNITTTIKIGGIETFYWEIANELQKQNQEVELISGKGNYIKYNHIPIKTFSYRQRDKILNLGNRFKKFGERLSFFLNSYRYLIKQKYDYLLIGKPLDFFVAFFIKIYKPDIKIIFVSGGEDFYGFDKFFSRYIDYMFAVSKDNKKIIQSRYKRNVEILHNGVDTTTFKPDMTNRVLLRKYYNLENKKVLISVGRIIGLKGYQTVIKSLKNLNDIYYILIGKGNYLKTLKDLAKKENVEKQVIFLGEIKNEELYKYLNVADVFIQPTIGNEAFGITLIEAMACNLAIVASNNSGILDIVQDSINGYLYKIGDKNDMEKKIRKAFDNRYEISKNNREYVKNNFSWKKNVQKLLKKIK